jgi:hypothetical protein
MLTAFATPKHRRVTLIFLAVFCLAVIATLAIGLDGNTPALVLAFVAATALVLAFVHPWRRARQFKHLLLRDWASLSSWSCTTYSRLAPRLRKASGRCPPSSRGLVWSLFLPPSSSVRPRSSSASGVR